MWNKNYKFQVDLFIYQNDYWIQALILIQMQNCVLNFSKLEAHDLLTIFCLRNWMAKYGYCRQRKSRRAVGSYIVLLDRKWKRERGSRGNGCFGKKKEEG